MKLLFAGLLVVHGLLHLLGFAKGYGLAALPQLTAPISRPLGAAWLGAALLMLAAAVGTATHPRAWWIVGAAALAASQVVIASSWADARFGTLANVVVLAGVVVGAASWGPTSLHASWRRSVEGVRPAAPSSSPITEGDLAALPAPVAGYLRAVGAVGRARPSRLKATFTGRFRRGANEAWMPTTVEQVSTFAPYARHFFMVAARGGVPFHVHHRYEGADASMRAKVLGLAPVMDVAGPGLSRAETVTVLNDMCLLAPASLLDASVRWQPLGDRAARVTFTNAGHTVGADLVFGEDGLLADFVSDDRAQDDGAGGVVAARWRTPVLSWAREGGRVRLGRAEARWQTATEDYAYADFEVVSLEVGP